jgi:putative phage-type endonuclease
MKIIELIQGSPEWHAHRAKHFNASDAPAMMGASKYKSRTDLLKELSTGITPEIDPATQRRFDAGHAAEAAARPIVEARLGESLYPVTGTETVDGLNLSASFDGITMLHDAGWESKLLNADLVDSVRAEELEPHYYWQLEHQLLVSGAERIYFTTSDGTDENTHGFWYYPVPERRAKLIAGWKQFAEDLANYQHVEATPEVVAAPIEALPALLVQVEGRVVATNMDAFKEKASAFIATIKTELKTDQDFADADKMAKFLGDGEKQLDAVKAQAQAQAASIDEVFRTIDAVKEQMRTTRLKLEKLVKTEKENRKGEIVSQAQSALMEHRAKLTQRLGGDFLPPIVSGQFAEAIKGLKSLDSMRDKVSTVLANLKIEASEIADRIIDNQKVLNDVDDIYVSLFEHDLKTTLLKERDDFKATVFTRVEEHKQRMEAERERIRREEEAKAQREAADKVQQQNNPPEGKDGTPAVARPEPAASVTTPETVGSVMTRAEQENKANQKAMLEAYLEKYVQPAKRNNIRAVIMAWEEFKAGADMEQAA